MRQREKGRHWKDNRTLGSRAFFHYKETGMRSETGAMQIASFLTIEALKPEDRGVYRCRVDFKEAPTQNTKIHLKLIGTSSISIPFQHVFLTWQKDSRWPRTISKKFFFESVW
jgi:hypothetical protein